MPYIYTKKGKLHYKSKVLYVGIKQINRETALENLRIVSNILKQRNIHAGPFLGTLLGIIRDDNFIEWDEDIDLYVLKEEEEALKNALWDFVEAGFEIIRYERRGLYTIIRNNEYIDFYILYNISPHLRCSGGSDYIPEIFLHETITWNFKDIPMNIPKRYDEFLTFQYGDWRTPVKYADFNMNPIQKVLVKMSVYVKNHIPDKLYFFLLHQYHRKDLKKFIEKCKANGIEIEEDITL